MQKQKGYQIEQYRSYIVKYNGLKWQQTAGIRYYKGSQVQTGLGAAASER